MSLNLGVHYGFAGRYQLWSCSTSQGLKWNKVDITVQLIHFDPVVNVYIDASVSGDATIAIGNIAKAGDGSKEKQCQSRFGNPTTSLEFSTTRRIPPGGTTSTFVSSSGKPISILNTNHHSKPTITTDILQDRNYGTTDSNGKNNSVKTDEWSQQKSHKFKRGAVIGASVAAGVLVVALTVFSIFMFKRNKRMWNIQKATNHEIETPYKGFVNQLGS
ncbi:unnamed protein product [Acanthosepion pharaonis]|uniref:Uncharacterized protein n=1 Tax=Acanthosepion pharaonis TaxID=158019 RepID=A0A812EMB7_ACAPH|nr:unnamed protein product [Sepia pharaonis]